ncbi:YdeI family protein [Actinomadura sp. 9N215]|uniref:YdeI family protein n=1 Tax=Actinomadura sp. 9N215 TaxID=3375150 RepID=UPI0037A8C1BD
MHVPVPDELDAALAAEPAVRAFFDRLTPSQQRGYTEWIEQARKPETRQRRLEETMTALRDHRKRR